MPRTKPVLSKIHAAQTVEAALDLKPGQSIELLKALHILTQDGRINQDSRRKLKQVYHLYHFIEPLLEEVLNTQDHLTLADMGAGKSYLGFILFDLFFKHHATRSHLYGIEAREELIQKSQILANTLSFAQMSFIHSPIGEAALHPSIPNKIDIITALHACDTATDEAIDFALQKKARFLVLVPCCQAELAQWLRQNKKTTVPHNPLAELWRHPLHTRELGSHLTNVLRCLLLEAHGYQVQVTELVGWEHSLKNELIIASFKNLPVTRARERLNSLLDTLGLKPGPSRFSKFFA